MNKHDSNISIVFPKPTADEWTCKKKKCCKKFKKGGVNCKKCPKI